LNILLTTKVFSGDFLEAISLILQTVSAAKFSSRACGLQRSQSADFIFHQWKFGFCQQQQEKGS